MSRPAAAPAAGDAYIGLGANLGDRAATIGRAFDEIAALPATTLLARSSLYASPPLDAAGGEYLNAVARIRTSLPPLALLRALQAIETRHGRERPYPGAPRTLDLDLLLHGSEIIDTPELRLPHPRLHGRAFVLAPLAEIAPDLIVPDRGDIVTLRDAVSGQPLAKLGR